MRDPSAASGDEQSVTEHQNVSVSAPGELSRNEHMLSQVGKDIHTLLVETTILTGSLQCGACGFEYPIKEGIANFLLPSHLV